MTHKIIRCGDFNFHLLALPLSIILLLPCFGSAFSIGSAITKSIGRLHTNSPLFSTGGNNPNSILNGGKTLSTKQILFPEMHFSEITTEEEPIPFFAALQSLILSLEKIMAASSSYNTNNPLSDEQQTLLTQLDHTSILRIEQSLTSVDIDPLCWLHGQQSSLRTLRHLLHAPLPVLYFADAEGQVEAAAIGQSTSFSDSWDPFMGKRIWDEDDGRRHFMKERDLPPRSRIYGGSRFDSDYYSEKRKRQLDDDDWDGFGGDRGGYWILPAVELRREKMDNSTSLEEPNERKVTLAIHLHNLVEARSSRHRFGWCDAARRILILLRELSDRISPPVPCTTLPPVVTRSESAGKGGKSGDGDSDVFERGVTEALRRIMTDNERDGSLRKVVLARKVDLNLGASVSGLDVLMRLKFGGHIGHLFYLNPGDDEARNSRYGDGVICSREFLGCAPERLFRVKAQDGTRVVRSCRACVVLLNF
jgi:isochorismate synthase EntC